MNPVRPPMRDSPCSRSGRKSIAQGKISAFFLLYNLSLVWSCKSCSSAISSTFDRQKRSTRKVNAESNNEFTNVRRRHPERNVNHDFFFFSYTPKEAKEKSINFPTISEKKEVFPAPTHTFHEYNCRFWLNFLTHHIFRPPFERMQLLNSKL